MGKKKYLPKRSKRRNRDELSKLVMDFFNSNIEKAYTIGQLTEQIGVKTNTEKQLISNVINLLIEDAFITETGNKRYKVNTRGLMLEGRFERRSNGKNFFVPDDDSGNISVAERNSAHAMNGDKVRIHLLAMRRGQEPEGEVIEILERKQQRFVGTLDIQKHFAFLVMDSKILANDIFIPKDELKGGVNGDKAIVDIVEWPQKAKNPIGRIVDILGKTGQNDTEMNAILAEFGLPYEYPKAVEDAANKISDDITAKEIAKREDFRKTTTITIDPLTAKDFDDALSIKQLANKNWEIGVHIADVTHYVHEGDIIDKEGESRANSVYLVDRTVPMLPTRLSNELCSLRPDEDKLAYSVIFEIDEEANVKDYRIKRTVIRSDRRFTYEEAQARIEGEDGDYKEEIIIMNELAKKLRAKRFKAGALSFDRHEVGFKLDEKGKPIGIFFKYATEANQLIEEFMLLANRTVAEFINNVDDARKEKQPAKTFIYRIHDTPDIEKLENLSEFIAKFGYRIRVGGDKMAVAKSLNELLSSVSGTAQENLISTIAVRTMAKAVYSTKNIGHYGLAFEHYSHFTSPIRRYPDMMAHRLLTRYIEEGKGSADQKLYEEKCEHCSEMEMLAANAERASIKYKQVEFMADKLGEEFDAVISGITEWGIYTEIEENKCEGMIPIRDLDDDFYEFDEKNYCLRGRRNKRVYQLGDKLTIKVARANLERKQLDFALVESK